MRLGSSENACHSRRQSIARMPVGQRSTIEDLLLESNAPRLLALHPNDGGIWLLDGPRLLRKHFGLRERISATRSGSNPLDV